MFEMTDTGLAGRPTERRRHPGAGVADLVGRGGDDGQLGRDDLLLQAPAHLPAHRRERVLHGDLALAAQGVLELLDLLLGKRDRIGARAVEGTGWMRLNRLRSGAML